jgi:hypothetical protein
VRSIMNPDKLAHLGHPLSPLATHAPDQGTAFGERTLGSLGQYRSPPAADMLSG